MKAMAKILNFYLSLPNIPMPPTLRSCADCKLRHSCPYKEAFAKVMFEINPDFAFAKCAQETLAEECQYFQPLKGEAKE